MLGSMLSIFISHTFQMTSILSVGMHAGDNVINNYVRKCKAIETYTSVDNAQSN